MHREKLDPKMGKLSNMVIIVIAVIVIFVFEPLAVALRNVSAPLVTVCQSLFIVALLLFCIWFYKKRLCSVRYTYITDSLEFFPDVEDMPEEFSSLENGTLLVETFVGEGNGRYLALIARSDMKALYDKGEHFTLPPRTVRLSATLGSKKDACALLFEQDGEKTLLFFTPSDALKAAIKESIENA